MMTNEQINENCNMRTTTAAANNELTSMFLSSLSFSSPPVPIARGEEHLPSFPALDHNTLCRNLALMHMTTPPLPHRREQEQQQEVLSYYSGGHHPEEDEQLNTTAQQQYNARQAHHERVMNILMDVQELVAEDLFPVKKSSRNTTSATSAVTKQ